jgi:hypothetical protein
MKLKLIIASVLLLQSFAHAGNRDESDVIFHSRSSGDGLFSQMLIGFSELIASAVVGNSGGGETRFDQLSKMSEADLASAQNLVASEREREIKIKAILANPNSYIDANDGEWFVGEKNVLRSEINNEIQTLRTTRLVTEVEKTAAIESAKLNIAKIREAALIDAQKTGVLDNKVKFIRRGTTIFLVVDVTARIYVWGCLDADPTLSPSVTFIHGLLTK